MLEHTQSDTLLVRGQAVKMEISDKLKEVQNIIFIEVGTETMEEMLAEMGYIVLIVATGIVNVNKVGENFHHCE